MPLNLPDKLPAIELLKEGEVLVTVLHQGKIESIITNCHSERSEESRVHPRGCSRDSSLHFIPL